VKTQGYANQSESGEARRNAIILLNTMSYVFSDTCGCLPVPDVESLPPDCKQTIFVFYIQWLIFLLNRNIMKNTLFRKSFKMLEKIAD
jgi:hypothetical protein